MHSLSSWPCVRSLSLNLSRIAAYRRFLRTFPFFLHLSRSSFPSCRRHTDANHPTDLLQGIPVGLAFGSIPFLLRSKLSYSQIGLFSLCTYPYSLKLLWSPVVDSIFSPKLGRRKSWIVPIQTIVGLMFWWLGSNVQAMMEVVRPSFFPP